MKQTAVAIKYSAVEVEEDLTGVHAAIPVGKDAVEVVAPADLADGYELHVDADGKKPTIVRVVSFARKKVRWP